MQMTFYDASYRLDDTPFGVFLHISWRSPKDLGSEGFVDHYLVRSGRAERNLFPIPPAFIEEPAIKEAPNVSVQDGKLRLKIVRLIIIIIITINNFILQR